ncbi:MAG: hypothetical protein R6U98_16555 [Pirellulaceae bacterium]
MENCPTQAVLPLVGLAADQVIRDRYTSLVAVGGRRKNNGPRLGAEKPCMDMPAKWSSCGTSVLFWLGST